MPDSDALQASRPTIKVAGTESSSLTGGLLRLRVRENVHGLSNCEAEFGNWGPNGDSADFLFFDTQAARLRQGAEGPARRRGALHREDHRDRGEVPAGEHALDRRARRGPVPGPAHDPADAHLRGHVRLGRLLADRRRPRPHPGRLGHRPVAQGARPGEPERPRVHARSRPGARRGALDDGHDAEHQAARGPRRRHPGHAHLRQGAARVPRPRRPRRAGDERPGDGLGRVRQERVEGGGDRLGRERRARPATTAAPACSPVGLRRPEGPDRERGAADERRGARARRGAGEAAGATLRRRPRHGRDEGGAEGRGDAEARRPRAAVRGRLLRRPPSLTSSTARRGCAPELEVERPGLGKPQ